MEPKKSRIATWLTGIAVVISLPFVIAGALWEYMSATATPLHPNPQELKSIAHAAPSSKWAAAVEQGRKSVRADLIEQNLPGVSVAVGVGGDLVWAEGFGWADLDNRVAVAPSTRFRIGTASKMFTSVAVGLLLEGNRLSLDEKIQTYVPEFPEKKWPVTLRQLMRHTAGVRTDGGDEGPLFSQHCKRPVESLQFFGEDSLLFEPGTRYRYSSYGWILVSAAVEAAAKEPFLTFTQKQIFEPLGMKDTLPDDSTAEEIQEPRPIPGRASPYFPRFAADPRYGPDPMRALDYSCYSGASVFLSTPSDLVRFGMAVNAGKLLQPATVKLLQASQRLPSGDDTGYGLGWDLETVSLSGKQTSLVGHDGDLLGGMATSFMIFPEHGIVVSVVSNTSYADTFAMAIRIAEAFVPEVGGPQSAQPPKPPRPPSGRLRASGRSEFGLR